MIQPIYRHEYKHEINLMDYHCIKQRIKALAKLDSNANQDGLYLVRSLYFDNDQDVALREKIDGLPNRVKYRIRIYNGEESCIKLEKKSKVSGMCNKQSVLLTRPQCDLITSGDIHWMAESKEALIVEFYTKLLNNRLKPKTIVDYNREAYIFPHGNVRVTFDSDIRTGIYRTNIFDKDLQMVEVMPLPGVMVLEVKYDNYLPDVIKDVIQSKNRHMTAFSKYASARIYG